MSSLADYLRALAPHLPAPLLPQSRLEAMARKLDGLPALATSLFGFECRLHNDPQVDVQCAVQRGGEGHHLLAEGVVPDEWRSHPLWAQAQRFAKRWRQDDETGPSQIVLAFDLDDDRSLPLPFLHFRTEKMKREDVLPLIETASEASLPQPILQKVQRCLDAAPVPAYVGLLRARGSQSLRWTLPLPLDEVIPFLRATIWTGDPERIAPILDAAAAWATRAGLSLNVSERMEPYLGLEFLNWGKRSQRPKLWEECLETLVHWKLCLPEKARALLAFPGFSHERGPQWPKSLRTTDAYRERSVRVLTRSLVHFKMVFPPDAPAYAKAYLSVRHGWLDRPSSVPADAPLSLAGSQAETK